MHILNCINRYLASRAGDVRKLKPPRAGFRLRCGDYRVFFDYREENTIAQRLLPFNRLKQRLEIPLPETAAALTAGGWG